ncbi:MAG: tRNA guanosine(34) transglycosylase Tgt [Candidatus Diapherotrites archaeon]|nr:tRNA guanosine(34) transglycosylase Tgt [Candidatus Diapherotrites archaeon]
MGFFRIDAAIGKARTGRLSTAHGVIETPFFMPVATKGSVKLLSNEEVESTGTRCVISNAFILSLRPGVETIKMHGGLHGFMNWNHGLFTDSGGFQVLSQKFCEKISDKGVLFKNPFDGKKSIFTTAESIRIQNELASDVAMCLDDVPAANAAPERLKESVERTTLWAKECLRAHQNKKQLLFGICQGGVNEKLRGKSAREISGLGFDGVAIGGLSIGESKGRMFEAAKIALKEIPENTPRYLMGVGSAHELVRAVALGVDVFDSCFPTRTARHAMAFSSEKNINIESLKYRNDTTPLDRDCKCFVCRTHSRAYIHHLVKTKEENGLKYLSYHNLFFIQSLMERIRAGIKEGTFSEEKFFTG